MNETIAAGHVRGKNVVVIGGSRGVGRAVVAAAHAQGARVLAIARKAESLAALAEEFPGVQTLQLDATDEQAPARVFAVLVPDILVICAGAIPHMAPLAEQSFEQFSRNWNNDVKMALTFSRAALTTPLPSGATVITVSSGAALGGSPMSGGYAGSKRTQMFIASYAQREAERMHLGLRFLALVPGGIMASTELGQAAVSAYAAYQGMSVEDYVAGLGSSPAPEDVADAVVGVASDPQSGKGQALIVTRKGLETVA